MLYFLGSTNLKMYHISAYFIAFSYSQGFARMQADMLDWTVPNRIYLGIQENSNTACAGIPESLQIPVWEIRYVSSYSHF